MRDYIIYVEDDEEDIELFLRFFPETSPTRVDIYTSGDDFLKILRTLDTKDYPCLIILDINMPQVDGFKLLDIIQRDLRFKKIPVLMFSTSTNPLDIHITEAFGMPFLPKPKSVAEWKQSCARIASYCQHVAHAGK